jgi:hypothetical protein
MPQREPRSATWLQRCDSVRNFPSEGDREGDREGGGEGEDAVAENPPTASGDMAPRYRRA